MRITGLAAALLAASSVRAAVTEIGPTDDFRTIMQGLQAGDTLILDAGTYTLTSYFALTLTGTAAQPILIRAQTGQQPIVQYVDASQNIVNLVNSTFVIVDGIEFTNGSRGIRIQGGGNITIQNCHVHGTAANAIAANDDGYVYANLNFIHNEIDHTGDTGEGFYLGCNDDACRIHDSLVANNYIHDLNGPDISQGDGIEIKKGSYANIVRDNVIHDTGYPGITMYDVNGNGAPNLIERNVVWATGDNGIQVTADATVRNNIVLSAASGASAFASNNIQNGSAANLVVVNNTFLMPVGNGIKLNGVTGTVTIANNAIYAPNGDAIAANGTLTQLSVVANAGQGSLNGVSGGFSATGNLAADFFSATLSGLPPQNLIPMGSLLPGAANVLLLAPDDFDGTPRRSADIGAYRANPSGTVGWVLAGDFKILDDIFFDGFESAP
jgi:Right handed beta helix region